MLIHPGVTNGKADAPRASALAITYRATVLILT